jgi:hypothetical protein
MAKDVENQLAAKLRKKKFTVQSTVNGSEAILLAYVRYIEDQQFKEEMLFCESRLPLRRWIFTKRSNHFWIAMVYP